MIITIIGKLSYVYVTYYFGRVWHTKEHDDKSLVFVFDNIFQENKGDPVLKSSYLILFPFFGFLKTNFYYY